MFRVRGPLKTGGWWYRAWVLNSSRRYCQSKQATAFWIYVPRRVEKRASLPRSALLWRRTAMPIDCGRCARSVRRGFACCRSMPNIRCHFECSSTAYSSTHLVRARAR